MKSLLALLFTVTSLIAHEVDQHFLLVQLEEEQLTARIEMDAGYALPELRDAEDETSPTGGWFAALSDSERERIKAEGIAYLRDLLEFQLGEEILAAEISFAKWGTDWEEFFPQREDTFTRVVFEIRAPYRGREGELELYWGENEEGPTLALQTVSGDRTLQLVTIQQRSYHTLAAVGAGGEVVAAEQNFSFFGWLKQGFLHVLPKGLDHILFILGLFLLTPKLGPLLKQSLVFTLAHSITLGMTVARVIPVDPGIIEPLIALSIVYIAVENLFIKELKPWRLALIFALGLLHGMGFGSVMSELPVEQGALILPVIGFNLGVEVAQIAVLLAAFVLTFWIRKKDSYRYVRITASLAIAAVGLFWTIERIGFFA